MTLLRFGLLYRYQFLSCYKVSTLSAGARPFHYVKRCRWSSVQNALVDKDLEALELPTEELERVQDFIVKTQAKNVSDCIKLLITYTGSASTASDLVCKHPNLLCCHLSSWVEFLTAFGLTKAREAALSETLCFPGTCILKYRPHSP